MIRKIIKLFLFTASDIVYNCRWTRWTQRRAAPASIHSICPDLFALIHGNCHSIAFSWRLVCWNFRNLLKWVLGRVVLGQSMAGLANKLTVGSDRPWTPRLRVQAISYLHTVPPTVRLANCFVSASMVPDVLTRTTPVMGLISNRSLSSLTWILNLMFLFSALWSSSQAAISAPCWKENAPNHYLESRHIYVIFVIFDAGILNLYSKTAI